MIFHFKKCIFPLQIFFKFGFTSIIWRFFPFHIQYVEKADNITNYLIIQRNNLHEMSFNIPIKYSITSLLVFGSIKLSLRLFSICLYCEKLRSTSTDTTGFQISFAAMADRIGNWVFHAFPEVRNWQWIGKIIMVLCVDEPFLKQFRWWIL